MGSPNEDPNFSKYKLHLRHGADGLSEKAASRSISRGNKRIRIQKMYKETPLTEGDAIAHGLPENFENRPPAEEVASNDFTNDGQDNLAKRDLLSHQQNKLPVDEPANELPQINRSVNLKDSEDFSLYQEDYAPNETEDNKEIEAEDIEIEEDWNSYKDPLQELIDEMEYMVECKEAENEEANKYVNILDDPKFYESFKKCSAGRSPAEVLLMVLSLSVHAKLPFSKMSMLIRMINALFIEEILPESKHMLDKIFNKMDHCEFHATCPDCQIYVGQLKDENDSVKCELCQKEMNLKNPSCLNFFLVIDPSQYIADYLNQNENYYDDVLNGKYGNNANIKDIYDGQLYKNFLEKLSEHDRKHYVTAIFNTDGAPRFESSPFSIWPIYLQINEIPPQERLRCAIPTALYFGQKKPNMDIFLDPFVEMMNRKSREGFEITIKQQSRLVKLYPLIGCADAVARAPMQGMVQFNGHYGCAWCEHEGEHDGSMRYPILDRPEPPLRSAESTEANAELATNNGIIVDGVKYASPLIKLKYFDLIKGFAPDYMHFYAIGVAHQFTDLYLENVSQENLEILDKIMISFAVPNQICRLSRPLSQRSHWKAKEWENWVLYYSLPILQLILTERALKHWALLVESLHILLSMDISSEMLGRARNYLIEFVKEAEAIFSMLVLTSNVHQLLHVCQSVEDWGPLWAHSNFVFESANAILLRAIHCATGVNLQIVRYMNLEHQLRILKRRVYPITDSVIKNYCEDIKYPRVQKTFKLSNIRYFGRDKNTNYESFGQFNLSLSKSQAFGKIIKDSTIYSQKDNNRSNNSYAQLSNGQFVKCLSFIVDSENNKEVTLCNLIHTSKYAYSDHILKVTKISNEILCVCTSDIIKVCVFLKIGKRNYICPVVNTLYY